MRSQVAGEIVVFILSRIRSAHFCDLKMTQWGACNWNLVKTTETPTPTERLHKVQPGSS